MDPFKASPRVLKSSTPTALTLFIVLQKQNRNQNSKSGVKKKPGRPAKKHSVSPVATLLFVLCSFLVPPCARLQSLGHLSLTHITDSSCRGFHRRATHKGCECVDFVVLARFQFISPHPPSTPFSGTTISEVFRSARCPNLSGIKLLVYFLAFASLQSVPQHRKQLASHGGNNTRGSTRSPF